MFKYAAPTGLMIAIASGRFYKHLAPTGLQTSVLYSDFLCKASLKGQLDAVAPAPVDKHGQTPYPRPRRGRRMLVEALYNIRHRACVEARARRSNFVAQRPRYERPERRVQPSLEREGESFLPSPCYFGQQVAAHRFYKQRLFVPAGLQ